MSRRFSYWFLFASFIVAIVLGAIRPLRVSPFYQVIGVIQFAAIALAAWALGARAITTQARASRLLALAGIFLITPFALLALLWVGLGPPWQTTAAENQMRYLVLTAMAIAIVVGFVVLREALDEADKKFRPSVGFANNPARRSALPDLRRVCVRSIGRQIKRRRSAFNIPRSKSSH